MNQAERQFVLWQRYLSQEEQDRLLDNETQSLELAGQHENYLYGECHVLALALHAHSGLPLLALLDNDPFLGGDECLVHVGVALGAGLLDGRGWTSLENIKAKYPTYAPFWSQLNPEQLCGILKIERTGLASPISEALPLAQAVYRLGAECFGLMALAESRSMDS